MKLKYALPLASFLLVVSLLLAYVLLNNQEPVLARPSDFFVGIDVAYDNIQDIKSLIDEVNPYTNLFLLGSTGISHDPAKLDELCQYLYEKDMYFIVYDHDTEHLHSLLDAQNKWGDKFIGLEYEDEIGGCQLDICDWHPIREADNCSDAANQFVQITNDFLNTSHPGSTAKPSDFHLFTADYAVYKFIYKAGYDVVLAEYGWNYSRQLNVALCRGAAAVQNKEWGVIITWTYTEPPYIESGAELYKDLVNAYENGAHYILIFDTNREYTASILKQEHFDALKEFCKYIHANPRKTVPTSERVAFVLPKDYGYGFRGPKDRVWGLWEAGEFEFDTSMNLSYWLGQYQKNLDIIYEDDIESNATYREYVFWNTTL